MQSKGKNESSRKARFRKSGWALLKEMIRSKEERVPNTPPAQEKLTGDSFGGKGLRITWLGHSSAVIQLDGHTILTDPMFGSRASPLPFIGPRRFNRELPLPPCALPPADAVLISHDHYDHLDRGSIAAILPKTKLFLVPRGVERHLLSWGVPAEKVVSLNWWEQFRVGGLIFVATPARHFSGRGLRRNATLWSSWIVLGKEQRVFFSGDGGYWQGFKQIGERYGPFAFTLLECGQYNENWAEIHMTPEETVRAHLDLRGEVLLPIHWGVFSISLHSWREPVQRVLLAAKKHGVKVATPKIGGQVAYGQSIPTAPWWATNHYP